MESFHPTLLLKMWLMQPTCEILMQNGLTVGLPGLIVLLKLELELFLLQYIMVPQGLSGVCVSGLLLRVFVRQRLCITE